MFLCVCNKLTFKDCTTDPEKARMRGTKCGRCLNIFVWPDGEWCYADQLSKYVEEKGTEYRALKKLTIL